MTQGSVAQERVVDKPLVRQGGIDDLPQIEPLIREAHKRMGVRHPPETTLRLLRVMLSALPERTFLLLYPGAYCWAELDPMGNLLIHQVYGQNGSPGHPLWLAIEGVAREHNCPVIWGIAWRSGGVRGFAKYGFRPIATVIGREVT